MGKLADTLDCPRDHWLTKWGEIADTAALRAGKHLHQLCNFTGTPYAYTIRFTGSLARWQIYPAFSKCG